MNKVLKIIGILFVAVSVLSLLGFVGNMRSSALCEKLEVQHTGLNGEILVSAVGVEAEILGIYPDIAGKPLNQINTRELEEFTRGIYHIKEAKVYKTIDRKLIVEIEERTPILRLIDENGISAYIDQEGDLLPVSVGPAQRLPLVTGVFNLQPELVRNRVNVSDSLCNPVLLKAFGYGLSINKSDFWKAQLQQTEVNSEGDFIAYPQVGNHTINFGDVTDIEQKLIRLKLFYDQGMNGSNWNKYGIINLKYKDQIVCTKK